MSSSIRVRRWLALTAMFGVIALLVGACGPGASDGQVATTEGPDGQAAQGTDGDGNADESCVNGDSTGVTDDTITIGNTNILSSPIAFIGEDANEAFTVPIDELNESGGVHGRQIEFVSYDDAYNTSMALDGARRLVEEDHIFAWAGGVGTPTYLAVVPYLEQSDVPAITPFAPARSIGTMEHPLTFMTWPNFIDEYRTTATYLVENEGLGQTGDIAFVHYNTDHGADAYEGTRQALAEIGAEDRLVLEIETTPEETDFGPIATDLANAGAEWFGFQLSSERGGQLLQAMKDLGYEPKKFTQGDYSDASFVDHFPDVGEGLYGGLQVAIFEDPPNPLFQQHEAKLLEETGKEMTLWRAVGYQQGLLTVEALKGMEAPTRECLIESLISIENFETAIQAPVTFGPEKRMGVDTVGVFQIQNGEVVVVKGFDE